MAQTDREALVALFYATDGPNWVESAGWDTNADLSEWHGVKVNAQRRVEKLDLSSNNLRGMLRPTLQTSRFCFRAMSLTFLKKSLTESDPAMKSQVLQEATTFAFWYVPALCPRSTPE